MSVVHLFISVNIPFSKCFEIHSLVQSRAAGDKEKGSGKRWDVSVPPSPCRSAFLVPRAGFGLVWGDSRERRGSRRAGETEVESGFWEAAHQAILLV